MGKDSSPHQHQSLQSCHDTVIVDSERKVGKGEGIIWKSDGKGGLDAVEWCCWISLLSSFGRSIFWRLHKGKRVFLQMLSEGRQFGSASLVSEKQGNKHNIRSNACSSSLSLLSLSLHLPSPFLCPLFLSPLLFECDMCGHLSVSVFVNVTRRCGSQFSPWDQTQVVRLYRKDLYPLCRIGCP